MTRLVAGLMLIATLMVSVTPAMAGDPYWNYSRRAGYPVQAYYPEPVPVKQERPLLQKILIGGALIGIGFAAGRLTAPKPDPYYTGYHGYPGYEPTHVPVYDPGWKQCRRF